MFICAFFQTREKKQRIFWFLCDKIDFCFWPWLLKFITLEFDWKERKRRWNGDFSACAYHVLLIIMDSFKEFFKYIQLTWYASTWRISMEQKYIVTNDVTRTQKKKKKKEFRQRQQIRWWADTNHLKWRDRR